MEAGISASNGWKHLEAAEVVHPTMKWTTLAEIQETQEGRNVVKTMIKWIANMLKCRNSHLTNQGSNAEVKVVKSCPKKKYYHLSYGI